MQVRPLNRLHLGQLRLRLVAAPQSPSAVWPGECAPIAHALVGLTLLLLLAGYRKEKTLWWSSRSRTGRTWRCQGDESLKQTTKGHGRPYLPAMKAAAWRSSAMSRITDRVTPSELLWAPPGDDDDEEEEEEKLD